MFQLRMTRRSRWLSQATSLVLLIRVIACPATVFGQTQSASSPKEGYAVTPTESWQNLDFGSSGRVRFNWSNFLLADWNRTNTNRNQFSKLFLPRAIRPPQKHYAASTRAGWILTSPNLSKPTDTVFDFLSPLKTDNTSFHAAGSGGASANSISPTIANDTFTNAAGTGLWSKPSNWSAGLPGSSNNVLVTGSGSASSVTQDVSATINDLTLNSGNSWTLNNNQTLAVDGNSISNAGAMTINSVGNGTTLIIGASNVTLSGGGTLTMSNNSQNFIQGASSASQTLTNQQTIQGSGNIGNGQMTLVNSGTINADNAANSLTINASGVGSGGTTNTGKLEATNAALLVLDGSITNTGGTILATGSGSQVLLNGSTVAGGTLTSNSGGAIVGQSGALLNGSTNTVTISSGSNFTIPNNTSSVLQGTVTNNGTLNLTSGGNGTFLDISGTSMTLNGSGNVTLSDNSQNFIQGASTGKEQLINQETIQGPGGNIGNNFLTLNNQGTIDATKSAGSFTLIVQPGSGGATNTSLLEATGGGSLQLTGTFTNTGGTITSGSGSTVTFSSASVTGGTINGSGTINSVSSTLNGVTNAGTIQIPNNNNTTLVGTINNTGTIQSNSVGNGTDLLASGTVTLTGAGKVTLSDNSQNFIAAASGGGSLVNSNNTISGSGNIGDNMMAFTNQGTGIVDATSASGNQLLINPGSAGATNLGMMEASSGGTLVIDNTLTNSNGTIESLAGKGTAAGGTVIINGATITGGTLTTLGTGVNAGAMVAQGRAILNGITNKGTIQVPNNNTALLEGTVTNSGTLQLNSLGNGTFLEMDGNVTLNGTGTVTLSNNSQNFIQGASGAGTEILTSSNTIQGGGNIGDGLMGLINKGTIIANQSTTLFVDVSSKGFANNGTLGVSSGDLMHVEGGPFTNFTGSTLTGGTYNISGTLEIDQLGSAGGEIVTNAANIILNGSSSRFIDAGGRDALSSLATNAPSSSFTITGGRNFTTNHLDSASGNFTNNGTLTVGSGSKFDVNGNLTNFDSTTDTLTGGTYNITGTLQFNGANIKTNAGNITLTGATSQIINQSSANGLANFATNASTGKFTIAGGRLFTTLGAFTNNGSLTTTGSGSEFSTGSTKFTNTGILTTTGGDSEVATGALGAFTNNGAVTVVGGSTFSTGGSFTNFSGTTLTGGTYNVTGTFQFPGANIVTNAANITLTGTSSKILNSTTSANGLANFTTNSSTGSLTIAGGRVFTPGAAFTNAGDLMISGTGSKLASSSNLMNTGTFSIGTGAAVTLSGAGIFTQTAGKTTDDGTLTAASVGLKGGSLFGKGSIVGPLQSTGTITPGDSSTTAGALTITGNYTQNSAGVLNIAIGGTTAGTTYDELRVSGTANINGTLNLSRLGGFVPAVGTQFDILTGSSVTGMFSTVTGTSINGSEHFAVACDTTDCDVTVVSGAAVATRSVRAIPATATVISNPALRTIRFLNGSTFAGGTNGLIRSFSLVSRPSMTNIVPRAIIGKPTFVASAPSESLYVDPGSVALRLPTIPLGVHQLVQTSVRSADRLGPALSFPQAITDARPQVNVANRNLLSGSSRFFSTTKYAGSRTFTNPFSHRRAGTKVASGTMQFSFAKHFSNPSFRFAIE